MNADKRRLTWFLIMFFIRSQFSYSLGSLINSTFTTNYELPTNTFYEPDCVKAGKFEKISVRRIA
jgi:hypothetical protein